MSNQLIMEGGPAPVPTNPRLQWWKNFDVPVYEIATLINAFGTNVVNMFPANRRADVQAALMKLQHLAVNLHHIIKHDVIAPLEQGKEPNIPPIELPDDTPVWDPTKPADESTLRKIIDVVIPYMSDLADRFGKDSNIGLVIADLFVAAEQVADEMDSVPAS
jgi:hypothetical protein